MEEVLVKLPGKFNIIGTLLAVLSLISLGLWGRRGREQHPFWWGSS